ELNYGATGNDDRVVRHGDTAACPASSHRSEFALRSMRTAVGSPPSSTTYWTRLINRSLSKVIFGLYLCLSATFRRVPSGSESRKWPTECLKGTTRHCWGEAPRLSRNGHATGVRQICG